MPVAACGDPTRRDPRRQDRRGRGGLRGRSRCPRTPVRSLCACMLRVPPRTHISAHILEERDSRSRQRGVSRMGMCASEVRTGTDCETRQGRSAVCVCRVAIVLFMRRLFWWSSGLRPADGRSAGPSRRICSCQKGEVFTLRYFRFITDRPLQSSRKREAGLANDMSSDQQALDGQVAASPTRVVPQGAVRRKAPATPTTPGSPKDPRPKVRICRPVACGLCCACGTAVHHDRTRAALLP